MTKFTNVTNAVCINKEATRFDVTLDIELVSGEKLIQQVYTADTSDLPSCGVLNLIFKGLDFQQPHLALKAKKELEIATLENDKSKSDKYWSCLTLRFILLNFTLYLSNSILVMRVFRSDIL